MKTNYLLIAIVLFAGTIRLINLESRFLWIDEQQSLLEANGIQDQVSFSLNKEFTAEDFKHEKTFANTTKAVIQRDSGNGIAYAHSAAVWTSLFGNSNFSIRLLSVIFSMMTVIVVFNIGKLLFDNTAGLIGAAIFSIHHIAISNAQEARSYSMATFFVALSLLLFFEIIKREKIPVWTGVCYGLASAMALLSHYFTFYILLAQITIAVFFCRHKKAWLMLTTGGVITGLVVCGWMIGGGADGLKFMELRNVRYQELSSLNPNDSFYGAATPQSIAAGILQMITHIFGIGFQEWGLRIRETIFVLIFPLGILMIVRNDIGSKKFELISLAAIIFSSPLVAAILAMISGHIVSFQTLYTNFVIPGFCVAIGGITAFVLSKRKLLSRALVFGYFLIIALSASIILFSVRHPQSDYKNWKEVARVKEENYLQGDILILDSPQDAMMLNMYFRNPSIRQVIQVAPQSEN